MAYRDPEVRRARDRERFQRRTAERIARGLCPKCGERPPEPDRSLCAPCAEQRNRACRARDAKLRAAGKPRRDPATARVSGRRHRRRQAAERRARGLCPNCGKQPPAPDASLCEPCSGQRRDAERARYAKGQAAGKPYGTPGMAGATPGSAERWRARRVGGACANASKRACAPDAGTGPRPRTARPASRAAKPARPPSANSMPCGAPPVSAPVAGNGPSTAPLPAHRAPCARAGAIRRRRTQPPDGSTPGGGPRGNAPTAESPRRARRGASPVRSGPGSAPNTSAGFRSGRRNTP